MRLMFGRGSGGRTIRAGRLLAGALCVASLAALGAAGPASATTAKEEFAPFAVGCPVETAVLCLYATTEGGEFVIGNKTVPITKPITLQGGLGEETEYFGPRALLASTTGETLQAVPQEVPGGLLGIAGLGGEVTATAEIAGPVSSVLVSPGAIIGDEGTALTLPLKVKLSNPVLGEECYVGTDSEPIVLHLTTGTTDPPPPNTPIHGNGGVGQKTKKARIISLKDTSLVDNSFSVPGASGCGGVLSPIVDLAVDADIGLPAAAGKNTAIMNGSLEQTTAAFVKQYGPKPKKKK